MHGLSLDVGVVYSTLNHYPILVFDVFVCLFLCRFE